ncbi:hypothetical protein LOTGIDRAFT_230465 [Lottia gigantea]|uniref:Alpha/beta hydrolase fold-3 domain-containing protein n=1 Tax=Lottia gigantea TaxID=225164 RepID=V4AG53_LOTGI|nr:hypothetical protein LOTGIDRAFT_230465 [Lottia gigantea]ESP03024.1 hypothetical protein LOTGIDRAFT_230465 [Lottia gigantea]
MHEGLQELLAKCKLHEESVEFLKEVCSDGPGKFESMTVEEMRQTSLDWSKKYGGEVEFEGNVKEFKVPSFASSDGIMVSVYKPSPCKPRTPIIVYFHGGKFVAGSRQTDDEIIKILARDSECIFVNVEYRLSPEHKFPAAFDDAKCVMRWVIMNKSLIGGVNDSKVGVLGVDCGGTVAATVCHEVPSIAFQILVYPILDLRFSQPSCQEYSNSPLLNKLLEQFSNMFLNENTESENVRASPLLRQNFSNLPPALFILADNDPIKDQGYEYKRLMKECNIDADSLLIKGSIHGFFTLPGHFKELGSRAQEKTLSFIKKRGTS